MRVQVVSIRALLLISALLPLSASAAVYVVDPNGGGDFLRIQDAITASATGDEILVRPGTYMENLDYLGKNLYVHGDGGASACLLDGSQGPAGAASCVAFRSGESGGAVLEGFTLRGGSGTTYPAYGVRVGGAVYCVSASCTLRACVFTGNTAQNGAAIFFEYGGVTVENSVFEDNVSETYGGAVSGEYSTVHFTDCGFTRNRALAGDGAVSFGLSVQGVLDHCTFTENSARAGAGLNLGVSSSQCEVRDCAFIRNSSTELHGGGIRVHEGSLQISGSVFLDNDSAIDGGGLFAIEGAWVTGSNCTFSGNGAFRYGGSIAVWSASVFLSNSIFANATGLGGVYADGGDTGFTCCDAWMNPGGNYVGTPDPTGTDGNIALDPLFCAPQSGDFTIRENSPCAPFTPPNPECDLIGALPVGCSSPVAVETITWGKVKSRFAR